MEPQLSQDNVSGLIAQQQLSEPVTPEPPHASLPAGSAAAVSKLQAERMDDARSDMTPPPSTQVPSSQRTKTRTPTPTISHISTPPPTIEMPSQSQTTRPAGKFGALMSAEQLATASVEKLRATVTELQAALQEAKMSAAHHKLQYQMLSQESAAAIERMAVEARMAQYENEVIHTAEQAKAAATPAQPSPFLEGMIPVQKDLYQRMCREIQQLSEDRHYLLEDAAQKEKTIMRQDMEIATLGDKVMMFRERIRENRQHMNRWRKNYASSHMDSTPRLMYNDPMRSGVSSQEQPTPLAALLQASEMASQEARRPTSGKKGHSRNTHSLSSLPSTPHHNMPKQPPTYQTPHGRQPQLKVPSTAPQPKTSSMRIPDVYSQQSLPIPHARGVPSEDTVSVDDDSEAETEIIEQDEVSESQASRAASQMLRSSQEQQMKRDSFKGSGMLQQSSGDKLTQTKLFGVVRKANVERSEERPAKRARTGEAVRLGIAGVSK